MSPGPAERVAEILRDELAEHGVRLPEIRADLADPHQPNLVIGTVPLGTGFALLRLLMDYRRLLKAERIRRDRERPGPPRGQDPQARRGRPRGGRGGAAGP
ncbi:hypothetical protein [Streptomyces sp. NBRC 110028]|uniref:hypothetical protein n=1 Tax=Streptomyces sp. NBRC 110028 TaxID=1621260 RepID=UPI001F29041F|nr:hypothetical protein [Streptomyces sp. NBRC 110028]